MGGSRALPSWSCTTACSLRQVSCLERLPARTWMSDGLLAGEECWQPSLLELKSYWKLLRPGLAHNCVQQVNMCAFLRIVVSLAILLGETAHVLGCILPPKPRAKQSARSISSYLLPFNTTAAFLQGGPKLKLVPFSTVVLKRRRRRRRVSKRGSFEHPTAPGTSRRPETCWARTFPERSSAGGGTSRS